MHSIVRRGSEVNFMLPIATLELRHLWVVGTYTHSNTILLLVARVVRISVETPLQKQSLTACDGTKKFGAGLSAKYDGVQL